MCMLYPTNQRNFFRRERLISSIIPSLLSGKLNNLFSWVGQELNGKVESDLQNKKCVILERDFGISCDNRSTKFFIESPSFYRFYEENLDKHIYALGMSCETIFDLIFKDASTLTTINFKCSYNTFSHFVSCLDLKK